MAKTYTSKIFELMLITIIVWAILTGFYLVSVMAHEQYHVYQLEKINQTPSEICWHGISYYKTDQQILGGWVRHEHTKEKISEVGPYIVTYIIMSLGVLCCMYVCKLGFKNMKGGSNENKNTTVRTTCNG